MDDGAEARCGICGQLVDEDVLYECGECGKRLCIVHADSVAGNSEVLCQKHRKDVLREHDFNRENFEEEIDLRKRKIDLDLAEWKTEKDQMIAEAEQALNDRMERLEMEIDRLKGSE